MSSEAELESSLAAAESALIGLQGQMSNFQAGAAGKTGRDMLAELESSRATAAQEGSDVQKLCSECDQVPPPPPWAHMRARVNLHLPSQLSEQCGKMEAANAELESEVAALSR
jgi:hypothetical protein